MSSWRPRLVALDVDGTLLGPSGVIGAEVLAAVARAAEHAHWFRNPNPERSPCPTPRSHP